jgi:hypothetical protein
VTPVEDAGPGWRTKDRYAKEMKKGHSKKKYYQSSKGEMVFSFINRTMGGEVRSAKVKARNNEMRLTLSRSRGT